MNPEPFLKLDRVIHEKGRLAIMSMLAASPELSFTELRDALAMTLLVEKGFKQEDFATTSESARLKYELHRFRNCHEVALHFGMAR